jgi:formylglycine-generating enzyme required for sulfatase activity
VVAGVLIVTLGVVAFVKLCSSPGSQTTSSGQLGKEAAAGSAFAPTIPNKASPPGLAPEGMVWIPGGEFSMGSDVASESLCGLA